MGKALAGIPQSQELRIHSGETNDVETLLLMVQEGGHSDLIRGIVAVELSGDGRFAQGVRAMRRAITDLLVLDGYVVIPTVVQAERDLLEADTMRDALAVPEAEIIVAIEQTQLPVMADGA